MVSKPSEIRCPSCRSIVVIGAKHFPFCTERCRFVDLNQWLEESYRIPVAGVSDSEDEGLEDAGSNSAEWSSDE